MRNGSPSPRAHSLHSEFRPLTRKPSQVLPKVPNVSHVSHVSRLLAELWKKIKHGSSASTENISEDDIVIFVVGPTGSGKSWFIREATKSDLVKVSREYHPYTGEAQAIRCELTDEAKKDLDVRVTGVVFVDTPSFLTECDHLDAEDAMKTWFNRAQYKPRFAGTIYLHRVESDPAYVVSIQKHIDAFAATFPLGVTPLPKRLRVVLSYDTTTGKVSESTIAERRSRLCDMLDSLKPSLGSRWQHSLHPERFEGNPEVAWSVVEELFKPASDDAT